MSSVAWWALYSTVLGWLCSKGINISVGAGSAPIGRMNRHWRMGWGTAPLWPVWWLAAMQPALGLLQKWTSTPSGSSPMTRWGSCPALHSRRKRSASKEFC